MVRIDITTEQFLAECLEQNSRRYIASLLGDIEAHLGKNPEISRIVKDTANASKRIMFTRLTNTEVESSRGGQGER